jgi:hypothetical protein
MMSEKHPSVYPWLISTYEVSQETPFSVKAISQFNCQPKRGGTDKSFFIVNHWIDPQGLPDPGEATKVNGKKLLTARLQQCITTRHQLPNALAVNFTSQGDLFKTVNLFNAAIARQSGVTAAVSKTVRQLRAKEDITDAELRELRGLHRLPKISEKTARNLLGPLADSIPAPRGLMTFASPCPDGWHVASRAEKKAARAATSTTTTTAGETTTTAPDAVTAEPDASATEPASTTTTTPSTPVVEGDCARG